jgi:hypothetical protein
MQAQVFANAVTVAEYAKGLEEGSLERVFVETFCETSDLLAAMPIRAATKGKFRFDRLTQLPTVANRAFNEPGNESTGKFDMGEEGVFLMDEYIKVDRALVDQMGPDRRYRQERAKMIAMAQNASRVIINGDNAIDPREPNGFKKRFNVANKTLFHNSVGAGGAALSLLNLDLARRSVNKPTHWIFPYELMAFVDAAARSPTLTNNQFMQGMDQELGRVVTKLAGLPILYGYEPDDSPLLLEFNEIGVGGGGAVTSSIYCVSLDTTEERCFMVEGTALAVKDEGQLQGSPFLSTHCKWDWGLATVHPRSGARLTSVTKATIVA